ncbi:hypothetical protein T11_7444 [Trichinella zimbabwensis]|uniref:Uncharacterized protein n=1 Tax=Trichinella zimbabwensis TaxID=268475 RepID=A0A0V1H226_9BILA|nr:hypothetical protein T11_7444 [Trichinella zimbabwensis]
MNERNHASSDEHLKQKKKQFCNLLRKRKSTESGLAGKHAAHFMCLHCLLCEYRENEVPLEFHIWEKLFIKKKTKQVISACNQSSSEVQQQQQQQGEAEGTIFVVVEKNNFRQNC